MIIFDLDGTLALCEHRRHFVTRPDSEFRLECGEYPSLERAWYPDWNAFYEDCDKDQPNVPIIEIFHSLSENNDIHIWSGRSESVRYKTLKWIKENVYINELDIYIERRLRMRPVGDNTPDDILKEKWLDETLDKDQFIQMVFDDRKKVVDMWRRRGITCLQVAEGKF